jgi:antitoxin component YwqK of YwqJK toxin-antitoxin module
VNYDAQGRIRLIERSQLESIEFSYYPGTDLIRSKKYLSASQDATSARVIRSIEYAYDSAGRVTEQTQKVEQTGFQSLFASKGSSHKYRYFYDGKQPSGEVLEGQVGFLTAVQGPDFSRTQVFRPDGKIKHQKIEIPGWKGLSQTFEYQPDGSIQSKLTELRDLPTNWVEKGLQVYQTFEVDTWGRLSEVQLNDHKGLAKLHYTPFSEVERVELSDGTEFRFAYDPVTHKVKGVSSKRQKPSKSSENTWELNNRGLIEQESFLLSDQAIKKQYCYTKNASLLEEVDGKKGVSYQYDSAELLTHFRSDSVQS